MICFTLEQGEHKTTKVRPVLDCRRYNEGLGPATYRGPDCGRILRELRIAIPTLLTTDADSIELVTLDMKQAFYRIRLEAGKTIRIKTCGKIFSSGRVTFGTKYGPAALEAAVRS